MKQLVFIILIIGIYLAGCKTVQVTTEAIPVIPAEMPADPQEALQVWKKYIDYKLARQEVILPEEYVNAAGYAFQAEETDLTIQWMETAMNMGWENPEAHLILADSYKKKDNLTRELNRLKHLMEHFPEFSSAHGVYNRLFTIFLEVDPGQAFGMWNLLTEDERSIEKNLDAYFRHARQSENNELSDSLSLELLRINPKHIPALEWNAEKYYNIAENHYQREMDKYNKNRNHVQYQFLLNALKVITEEFKQSLRYFEILWEMDQNPRYAAFMANIYARFNNSEKSNYFRKFVK